MERRLTPAAPIATRVERDRTMAAGAHRSRCAPGAAVWQCARWASMKRVPYWRMMSATSKGGRVAACAVDATDAPCPDARPASCRADWPRRVGVDATSAVEDGVFEFYVAEQQLDRAQMGARLKEMWVTGTSLWPPRSSTAGRTGDGGGGAPMPNRRQFIWDSCPGPNAPSTTRTPWLDCIHRGTQNRPMPSPR